MTQRSGGEALVEALRREGVRHVFGVIGTAMLDVYDALYDCPDIRYVGVRHEQNAAHMADGYARVSNRPGVVLVGQPGPGTTNLVSGVAEAYLAYSPVVTVAGSTSTAHVDRGTFQEVDQQALFGDITKRTTSVPNAARLTEYVHEAFQVSMSGRRGPVVVNVPGDLLGQKVDDDPHGRPRPLADRPAPTADTARRAAALLDGAARPVILAGGGVTWAGATDDLRALAERCQVPVLASGGHGDVMPNDHELYIGQAGPRGNDVATGLLRDADVVLAIGTRLGYNTTLFKEGSLAPGVRVAQVDIAAEAIGRHFPVEVGLVADAGEAIRALAPLVSADPRRAVWVEEAKAGRARLLADRAAMADREPEPMHPLTAVAAVQRALPRDAIVCADTGTCSLPVIDGVQTFVEPRAADPARLRPGRLLVPGRHRREGGGPGPSGRELHR